MTVVKVPLSTHPGGPQASLSLYKMVTVTLSCQAAQPICSRVSAQPSVHILAATEAVDDGAGNGDKEGKAQLWVVVRGDTQAYAASLL